MDAVAKFLIAVNRYEPYCNNYCVHRNTKWVVTFNDSCYYKYEFYIHEYAFDMTCQLTNASTGESINIGKPTIANFTKALKKIGHICK